MLLQLPLEMIPNEFKTWGDYKEAFRNPILQEIWAQIDSGMDTISRCLYVPCPHVSMKNSNSTMYQITVNAPEGVVLKSGDIMLFSAKGLNSREQIIQDRSFCAILYIVEVLPKYMLVRLSQNPFGGSLNTKNSYQIMYLASLKTYQSIWKVMNRCHRKISELCNLICTKNMNGVCPDISLLI